MQLSIPFPRQDEYSDAYFVPHSGMADALEVLEKIRTDWSAGESVFRSFFVYGELGTGKSHLLAVCRERLEKQGAQVSLFDADSLVTPERVRSFIDAVEQSKVNGGIILIEGRELNSPLECSEELKPHVKSRILGGYTVRVTNPPETELKPLVMALLEKRGLRFSDYSVDQLIRNLPRSALSFARIIEAIDEFSLSERRRINNGVIQAVLRSSQ
jgi:DnaA family protein